MNENKKLVEGWNIIGEAPVDSGQLMICDPGYLKQFKKEEVKKLGVIFNSGFGDGIYPIEALVKNYGTKKNPNLRIAEIRIDFIKGRVRFGKSIKNKNNTIFCYK